jgi:hypothetical protein
MGPGMRTTLRVVLCVVMAGCGADDIGDVYDGSGASEGGGAAGDGGGGGGSGSGSGSGVEPGQLTAGEWDDAANFAWYEHMLDTQFATMIDDAVLPLEQHMITTITDSLGQPIAGATIEIDGTPNRIVTGTDGRALLLPGFDGGSHMRVIAPDGGSIETDASATIVVPNAAGEPPEALDLAFVVDATGSMGDEISYLQAEIENIAVQVAAQHPGVSTRFGLVMYRDVGDEYVTRTFDFSSLASFKGHLLEQSAGGGGDYPEAAEAAMQEATTRLTWRGGNVARVLFQVADAPPHVEHSSAFLRSALVARAKGIRIFPVAASGVAVEAEYLMRSSALATLGRYLFLTDDSGIGDVHEEPRIPCFRVERLATLLARTIDSELTGAYIAPAPEDVLRESGFTDGRCTIPE